LPDKAARGVRPLLDISLLGGVRIAVDGTLVALRSTRVIALLGFLATHRDAPQRRELIAALFWPDSPESQARTNLRRELHSMRAELPQASGWLTAESGTLLWHLGPGCRLDVAVFDAAAGAYAEAIELAHRRVDLEPLAETGYRSLLELQALAGDRAAALQTYHRCVSVLERELGVAPDQATTAAYEHLAGRVRPRRGPPAQGLPAQGLPAQGLPARAAAAGRPAPAHAMAQPRRDPPASRIRLVGRDAGWNGVIVGGDPDPANAARLKDWAVRYWEALHPTSAGGAYVNFMMDEGTDRVRASYGRNYDRLARVKAVYDPQNFFRVNQNVTPAG